MDLTLVIAQETHSCLGLNPIPKIAISINIYQVFRESLLGKEGMEGKCSLMCHTQIVQSDQITLFLYYVYFYIKYVNSIHTLVRTVHFPLKMYILTAFWRNFLL